MAFIRFHDLLVHENQAISFQMTTAFREAASMASVGSMAESTVRESKPEHNSSAHLFTKLTRLVSF